jgi:hypothetical protein
MKVGWFRAVLGVNVAVSGGSRRERSPRWRATGNQPGIGVV